jgi:Ca-activated chloride channel homolog
MTFGAPGYLLLLVLPLAAAASVGAWIAWRAQARRRFGARDGGAPVASLARAVLVVLAVALVALAAARPQFGAREVEFEDTGIDLVIALDVSLSMMVDDVEPTRLARAQEEIAALLEQSRGDRVGLVTFAGDSFPRSPLTSDLGALRTIVLGVDQERALVAPGSDLAAAIRAGERLLTGGDAETKVLVLVSDGEHFGQDTAVAVESARSQGIVVYAAGVGAPGGAQVRDLDPETGEVAMRVDADGQPVVTRLDRGAMQAIAAAGGGRYLELAGEERPLAGLAPELGALARTLFGTERESQPVERFQLFALAALALVAGEMLLSALWRRRPRFAGARRLWPVAGAAMLLAGVACASGVAELNREGNRAYDDGEYARALERYREAATLEPERDEPYYNAGNALHRAGEYDGAIEEAQRALPAESADVEAMVEYAIGNHHLLAGRFAEAVEAYKRALLANPRDADAKHNLELALAQLRPMPTPEPPPVPTPEVPPGPDGGPGDPDAMPDPGEGVGTPSAGGVETPPDAGEMTPDELQEALRDALAASHGEMTVEEALRVLDLVSERNRQWLEQRPGPPGAGSAPDY